MEVRGMTQRTAPASPGPVVYPESDGLPMSDNTRQFRWIVVLYGNLAALFRDAKDVFVSGNQFWYPVEGEPEIKQAPDVYVVFGRPVQLSLFLPGCSCPGRARPWLATAMPSVY